MATFTDYTHEFLTEVSDTDWNRLWENNPHIWEQKTFPQFLNPESLKPGVYSELPHGINNSDDALIYIKMQLNSFNGMFHIIRHGEDAIGMRYYIKVPKFEVNPFFVDILGDDYQDDTAHEYFIMFHQDEDGSREWAKNIHSTNMEAKLLEHTRCVRYFGTHTNLINKNYLLNIVSTEDTGCRWIGNYVADEGSPIYHLSDFGWPEDLETNIGMPE